MSRIQTILDKAEREGTARRFRNDPVPGELASSRPIGTSDVPMPFEAAPAAPAAAPEEEPVSPFSRTFAAQVDADVVAEPERQAPSPSRRIATRIPLAPALVAALDPNALAAEQFRTLRTRIANSANGRGARRDGKRL